MNGINKEFTVEMVDVALAQKAQTDAMVDLGLLQLRSALVASLSTGRPLLINIGMLSPDFNRVYTNAEIFPARHVFDRNQLLSERIHRPMFAAE